MKTITKIAAIATILLAFNACQKESTSPLNNYDENGLTLKKAVTKNFKITKSSGTMSFAYGAENECYPNTPQNQTYGSGTATHIGNYTIQSSYCVDENGIPVSAWSGKMTAANGDEIFILNADPNATNTIDEFGNAHVEFNIIGGTGRFVHATGHYSMDGTVDFVHWEWHMTGEGTIRY